MDSKQVNEILALRTANRRLQDALIRIQTFGRSYEISQGEAVRLLEQCTATAYYALQS